MCAHYRNVRMSDGSRNFSSRAKVISNDCLDTLIRYSSIDVCHDKHFVAIGLISLGCLNASEIDISISWLTSVAFYLLMTKGGIKHTW